MSAEGRGPPPGFRLLEVTPARAAGFNPIAFHEGRHLNPGGRCHGGVLAAFCDVHLAFAILFDTPTLATTIVPTVSLNIDYLAGVGDGAWVEAVGGTIAVTRNLAFAQAIVTADGVPAVRASGTYKVGGARVTGLDTGAWLRGQVGGT